MDTQSGGTLADRIAALQGSKKNDTGGNSVASSATDRGSVSNLSSGKVRSFSFLLVHLLDAMYSCTQFKVPLPS